MVKMAAEDMETRVFRMLVEVREPDILQEACEELGLQVSVLLKGKRKPLHKLIVKYLYSDEVQEAEDEGLSIFLQLNEWLTENTHHVDEGSASDSDNPPNRKRNKHQG